MELASESELGVSEAATRAATINPDTIAEDTAVGVDAKRVENSSKRRGPIQQNTPSKAHNYIN